MKKIVALLGALVLLATTFAAPSAAAKTDNQALNSFDDGSQVGAGAHTSIQRGADAVSAGVHARRLEPGHAYTVWLVIFNVPGNSATSPCSEPDLDVESVDPSVMWSGVGGVANGGGTLNGQGGADVDNSAEAQVLFGPGLADAAAAEIHFIVRDHGPATGDASQTSSFEGECTPESSFGMGSGDYECADVQFSIHQA